MSEFIPSVYQQEVFDFIKYGHGNAVVEAVAGSGKSKTIIECLKYIEGDKRVLFLAFNNAIVESLKGKINREKTDVKTLHSLGYSILKYNFKDIDIKIDELKYKKKLNVWFNHNEIDGASDDLFEGISDGVNVKNVKKYKSNILKLTDLGRYYLTKNKKQLEVISIKHNIVLVDNEIDIALALLAWAKNSLEETNSIDFGDMLYLPNILPIRTFKYDFIIIDEAQDLSYSQLQLFLKCFKQGGRFIAVGDKNQSIYGFSGSDTESFNKIKSLPSTILLPLSICYRCPTKVIELAKKFVPEIEARENAIEGYINYKASIDDIIDGDMIICRNTLPLVKLYLKLISEDKKAFIKGKDIGVNLIDLIKDINVDDLNTDLNEIGVFSELYSSLLGFIEQTKSLLEISESEVFETQEFNNLLDSIECLEIVANGLETKLELINKLTLIFKDNNGEGICLSTIHKAKGLEADNVYILNKNLMPSKFVKQDWEKEQERNLEYVAYTRPKKMLGFIYSKDEINFKTTPEKIAEIKYLIEKL